MPTRAIPVLEQLGPMHAGPLQDEPKGARLQSPSDHFKVLNVDRRLVAALAGMKVRATEMLDLVVVHPDHDPVERADPRHSSRVRRIPAAS